MPLPTPRPAPSRALRGLLLLPFLGLLAVPLYNRATPSLFGFPFFFWYLFAWVPLTSALIAIVHRAERGQE